MCHVIFNNWDPFFTTPKATTTMMCNGGVTGEGGGLGRKEGRFWTKKKLKK